MNQTPADQKEQQLSGLEIGIALAAIRPLAASLIENGLRFCGRNFKQVKSSKLVGALTHRAQDISQVKTLLCLEQPVHITDFYSEQNIVVPSGERVLVASPDTFRDFPRVVVAGVAGQGKSILFRYLALHEIARKRLPLFIELRNFEHTNSIRDLLLSEIETLGFPKDDSILDFLLESGTASLYLDAFDEIRDDLQSLARKQIEDIARRHVPCPIFVSTRPTLSIEASNHFRVSRLDNLRPDEAINALRNMCNGQDNVKTIEDELNKANHRITGLLSTPLMVALLLLHYRLSGEFPETEQAFFGDLFDVLLRRHDQTKGYSRERHSNASELELHDLFGYISFACRQEGSIELQRSNLLRHVDDGRKFYAKEYPADGALRDIIEGTNLILEEGASNRFAHKAIQEFYAAGFLSGQPESNIQQFLRNRIKKWDQWEQMLEFVELINPHMFYKHFLIPHCGWIAFEEVDKRVSDGWIPSKRVFDEVFGEDSIGIQSGTLFLFGRAHVSRLYLLRKMNTEFLAAIRRLFEKVDWETVPDDDTPRDDAVDFMPPHGHLDGARIFKLKHLLAQKCGDLVRQELQQVLIDAYSELKSAYEFVDLRAKRADFFT